MIIQKTACFLYVFIWLLRSVILVRSQGPRFKENMTEKYTVSLGQSVKLYCPVSGTDDPASNRTLVVWSYGGHFIVNTLRKWTRFKEKKNGKYLKIVRVKKEDAGLYTCRAYNEHGYIKMNITLTIKSPRTLEHAEKAPKFRKPARRLMPYKAGETAKLNCHSSGNPDPDVQWFKDGESYGQHKRTSISPNGWTLNLRYLTVQDSGIYLCRVSNKLGSINRTFTVMVKARTQKPVIEEPDSTKVTVRPGKNAKLECRVWSVGAPVFKWRRWSIGMNRFNTSRNLRSSKLYGTKYLNETINNARSPDSFEEILVIKNVTKEDEGQYSCVVTNIHGTDEMELYLRVAAKAEKPYVMSHPVTPSIRNTIQKTQNGFPILLVVSIIVSLVVTMIFIVVLILCCRKQRKELEKQYEFQYSPQDLVQQHQSTNAYHDMQKVAQKEVSSGNSSCSTSWNGPCDSAVKTFQCVREHFDRRFTSAKETQSPQPCLGNQKDPKQTPSNRSDLNDVHSGTSSQTTLNRQKTNSRKSLDSGGNTDYSVSNRPPDVSKIASDGTTLKDSEAISEDSKTSGNPHVRESVV